MRPNPRPEAIRRIRVVTDLDQISQTEAAVADFVAANSPVALETARSICEGFIRLRDAMGGRGSSGLLKLQPVVMQFTPQLADSGSRQSELTSSIAGGVTRG